MPYFSDPTPSVAAVVAVVVAVVAAAAAAAAAAVAVVVVVAPVQGNGLSILLMCMRGMCLSLCVHVSVFVSQQSMNSLQQQAQANLRGKGGSYGSIGQLSPSATSPGSPPVRVSVVRRL